jgi:hypothetical protein
MRTYYAKTDAAGPAVWLRSDLGETRMMPAKDAEEAERIASTLNAIPETNESLRETWEQLQKAQAELFEERAAAWLRERVRVVTASEAAEILNRKRHRGLTDWRYDEHYDAVSAEPLCDNWLLAFEAIAVAEKYLAGEVAAG